jgi:anti-anti-sigma factor
LRIMGGRRSRASRTASTDGFRISVHLEHGHQATLGLCGELDLCSVDLFSAVLGRQVTAGRKDIRVDLSGVAFMDCAGLTALVEGHHLLADHGGELTLTHVGTRARRLMRMTGLDVILNIEPAPVADDATGAAAVTA